MCIKLVSFVCVLALASASYGEVIGDFGNGTDGLDGWVTMPGEAGPVLAPTTASVSTIGATLGGTSLKLVSTFPIGYGWYEGKIDKVLTAGQAASVADGTYNKFKLDVARFSDDWSAGAWGWWTPENQLFFSLSASAWNDLGVQKFVGGGREILGANWYPSMLATYRAPENRLPWRGGVQYADPDGTMATSWDLTGEIANIKAELTDAGYIYDLAMDVKLIVHVPDYYPVATFYLDNAQLTPEPATMALLGLGGLALIRRKR